jgi:hypothetical protein
MSVMTKPGATALTVILRLAIRARAIWLADQACLARRVICLPGVAHQTDHRADIDDAATALLGHRAN